MEEMETRMEDVAEVLQPKLRESAMVRHTFFHYFRQYWVLEIWLWFFRLWWMLSSGDIDVQHGYIGLNVVKNWKPDTYTYVYTEYDGLEAIKTSGFGIWNGAQHYHHIA